MRTTATAPARSRSPPHPHYTPPAKPEAANPTSAPCKQPQSHALAPSLTADIFRWSVAIPAISLALLARSLLTIFACQAPAAAAHAPNLFLQLLLADFSFSQLLLGCLPHCLVTLILSAGCTAATLLAPFWYRQGGREQLLAAVRLLPKAITVLQLLLLSGPPLEELQRVWLHTCIVGVKGLLAMMIWPVVFPTPVRSYLKLAPLECGLSLAVDCMFTFRTSSPPAFPPLTRITTMVLLYAMCGAALPAAALLLYNTRLHCQRPQLVPHKASTSLPHASCTTPSNAPLPQPKRHLDVPASNNHADTAAAPALQPLAPTNGPQTPVTAGTSSTVARSAAASATSGLPINTPTSPPQKVISIRAPSGGPRTRPKMALYRSRSSIKVLSIKIHNHQAYARREAILASLTTVQTPPTTSPSILLASCAVEGCLQLIFTTSTLHGSHYHPLPFADDPCELFAHLHSQLPASCHNGLVTFHMDDTFQAFEGSSGQQLPPELLHLPCSDGGEGLQWAPVSFEAGLQEEIEVELTCSMVGGGVEAVVLFGRQGVDAVEKLPLQPADGSTGRLLLPAGLDPGPVTIHVVSTEEGRQGVLLGSATTMALPPPAAAEMKAAYNWPIDGDVHTHAAYQSTIRELLRDYALCWQLHGSHGGVSQAALGSATESQLDVAGVAQMTEQLLQYLSCANMTACCALLSARCIAASASAVDSPATTSGAPSLIPPPAAAAAASAAAEPVASALAVPSVARAGPSMPAAATTTPGGRLLFQRWLQRRLAPWLCLPVQRLAACWAHLRAVSSGPGFTTWKLQQTRWVDGAGWIVVTTMSSLSICLSGKRLLGALGFGMPWVLSMAFLLLQFAPAMVAHMLLAVAGERLRRRREVVVLVFAAVKAAGCMVGVWGWLNIPEVFRAMWGVLRTAVVVHGVLRPCLLQVSWRVQLLVSSIEEAGRYAALTAAPCRWDHAGGAAGAQLPSGVYARLSLTVVAAALVCSSVMEALYLSAYARHVAASRVAKHAAAPEQPHLGGAYDG